MMRFDDLVVIAAAALIAVAGAREHAGGWNDGSHLAAAESLVDRGTFAIDDSIFVRVPGRGSPYPPVRRTSRSTGRATGST